MPKTKQRIRYTFCTNKIVQNRMRRGSRTVNWDTKTHSDDSDSDVIQSVCIRCGKSEHKEFDFTNCVIPSVEEIEKETEDDIEFAESDMANAKNLKRDTFGYYGYTQSVETFPIDKSFQNTKFCFNCGSDSHTIDKCPEIMFNKYAALLTTNDSLTNRYKFWKLNNDV